jgi:hypothetical protein
MLRALLEVEVSKKCTRLFGAKHISKSECEKHFRSGALLQVDLLKKRTSLWREAHLEVKMQNTTRSDRFAKMILRDDPASLFCGR